MRTLLKRFFLLCAGLLAALAACEAVLRLFPAFRLEAMTERDSYRDADTVRSCRYSRLFGYDLIPHADAAINALGMRDREYPVQKPDGAFRILLLGDSITEFGRWSEYVEDKLAAGGRYEILNAAVRGWGLYQYDAYLHHKAAALGPDLVIIGFCLNDVETARMAHLILADSRSDRVVSAFLRRNARDAVPAASVNWPLFRISCLYRLVCTRLIFQRDFDLDDAKEAALAKLTDDKRLCRGKLLAVIYPYLKPLGEYTPYEREEYRLTRETLGQAGIEYLDLTGRFHAYGDAIRGFRLNPADQIHFNERANRIMAADIYRWLAPRLPPAASPGGHQAQNSPDEGKTGKNAIL